ncbi:N-lysine methyltransferase SETD6-like isoform X3 [Pyrus x bretschneideri]|uniref:N-lysine methyltransferase SETD6-like isoform X3 n=1 Tax=Pyrus x bretschneideri TaxID=225117 RepID=UPI0020309EC4|nr:N-lysine methyltransferase SETD6-like isoform X3 [Pyrus x bretschneideri]
MATNKPSSCFDSMELDKDCSIVLELSESDPLFDKNKLLQDKGFNTRQQIHVKRSADPNWLSTSLEVMLQIAKIIESTETAIVEGYNSDKGKQLLRWGENIGVKTRLQIAHVEGAGRGAIAADDQKVGETALEIPMSLIVSEELVQAGMYHVLEKFEGITPPETMLLLWSMKERRNCDSKYKMYFDTLPEDFHTAAGLSFGANVMMVLGGIVLLDEITQAKQHLLAEYDKLFPALFNEHPDIFLPELYTWEQFLWACELWYSNSMKIKFPDGKLRTCLIPIAAFLNHSKKKTYWDVMLAVESRVYKEVLSLQFLTWCYCGLKLVKHELSKMDG